MGSDIPERDWKALRDMRVDVLARFCDRILEELTRLANDKSTTSHERYLLIYSLIQDRDDEIDVLFSAYRRSVAKLKILALRSRKLLTEEEFSRFSPETQLWADSQIKSMSEPPIFPNE